MPQERLPKQALLAKLKGKNLMGQPRTCLKDYIVDLGWNCLGLQASKMVADCDVCWINLELLTSQSSRTLAGSERRSF